MKKILIQVLFFAPVFVRAQQVTTFPSLTIPASSRGLGMGDVGIASATENQALWYNASKTAFAENIHQASVSYTPYLAGISNDIRFMNANYLNSMTNSSALGFSLNYLDLGNIETKDDNGATLAMYHAREFNLATSYALELDPQNSIGATLRFLGSQPSTVLSTNGSGSVPKSVYTASADISYYGFYEISEMEKLEWGITLSNLGLKESLLPTNIGAGIAYTTTEQGSNNHFTAELNLNELTGLSDLRASAGMEYCFADQFFLRGGISLENKSNGNRKFFGLGLGFKGVVKEQSWGADFHWLIPFATVAAVSPFQNAYGITLQFAIGHF